MRGDMHYTSGEVMRDNDSLRIQTYPQLTVGQLLTLPLGTELLAIHVGPMGLGLMFKGYIIDEEFKNGVITAEFHENCDHGMTLPEIEASLFPGSVFIVLTPEDYVPDMSELLNEKFVRKGYRDGLEGMPPLSTAMLQAKFPDEWHDEAYVAYTTAYKRGTENRKKGR